MVSMISLTVLAKAEEWLTCTDMTTTHAAKALDVDPAALRVALGYAKYSGISRPTQVLSALEDFGQLPTSRLKEIMKCSADTVRNAVTLLIKGGEVERVGGKIPLYKLRTQS